MLRSHRAIAIRIILCFCGLMLGQAAHAQYCQNPYVSVWEGGAAWDATYNQAGTCAQGTTLFAGPYNSLGTFAGAITALCDGSAFGNAIQWNPPAYPCHPSSVPGIYDAACMDASANGGSVYTGAAEMDYVCKIGFYITLPTPLVPTPGCCKSTGTNPQVGEPIDPGTGNEYHDEIDYQSGDSRLQFRRSYNSSATASGTFGGNWQDNFTRQVLQGYNAIPRTASGAQTTSSIYSDPASACTQGWAEIAPLVPSSATASYSNGVCQLSTGQIIKVYNTDTNAAWTSASSYAALGLQRPDGAIVMFACAGGICTPNSDVPLQLSASSNGFTLTDEHSNTETYTTAGALTSISYLDGYRQTFTYNTDGTLGAVSDNRGRQLQLAYTNGLLTGLTLPDGSSITYGYAPNNALLQKVTYPDKTSRTYQYSNLHAPTALTGIVDENNVTYATNGYDTQGRANSDALGGGIANGYSIVYNSDGSATVTDPLGAVRTYKYQQLQGRPKITAITGNPCDRCGPAQMTYDAAGYPQSRTDFNNNVTNYTYDDTRGLETQRIEAVGTSAQRTTNTVWDPNFRVPDQRSVVNANGVTESLTNWSYNTRGQVSARCEVDPAVSGASSYVCGSATNAPKGVRQWSYTYCEQSGVIAGTCPLVGLLLSTDGPRTDVSDVTTYAYYQTTDVSGCATLGGTCHYLGDLHQVTNAMGQVTTYVSYDLNGRVTRQQDANGVFTDMTYSPRGWLLMRTVRANANGTPNATLDATTTFGYDNVGNVTSIVQPDGTAMEYVYDAAHRLTDIYDSPNITNYTTNSDHIHYTLDAAGNRTGENTYDPSGAFKRALTRNYDQLDHLLKTLNASGVAVQQYINPAEAPPSGITYNDGYDGNGNAVYSTDANGVGTEQQYDPLNRLVKTLQDHAGTAKTKDTTTQYAYDARDNLRSVTDPDGLVTSYTYDGLNNLTQLTSPDTGTTLYPSYDAAGNRLSQTDARGITTNYTYDALNRLTGITYPTTSLNVTYTYDQPATGCYNIGRLTKMTDSSGSTTYCYDQRGNVLSKTQVVGGVSFTTQYTYTLADRLRTVTYPSGAVVTYGYDATGRVNNLAYQATASAAKQTLVSSVAYLPFGPLSRITYGDNHTLTKSYDSNYAISGVVSSLTGGLNASYQPDPLGNITHIQEPASTVGYGYDALYRLGSVSVPTGSGSAPASSAKALAFHLPPPSVVTSYAYDGTGDVLSKTTQYPPPGCNGCTGATDTWSYAYAPGTHWMSSFTYTGSGGGPQPMAAAISDSPTAAYVHDPNGNTTARGDGGTYTYDDRNRLASVTIGGSTYAYLLNGRGERIGKTQTTNGATVATRYYAYNESGQLLGEYGSTGGVVDEFVYLDSLPVAEIRGGLIYYIETDHLGTPRAVIDPNQSSALVWSWDLNADPFGAALPTQRTDKSGQPFVLNLRFPGQYYDAETGLNYNYFRDYEPGTGRYVESDPIGLSGGLATYAYAKSRPTRYKDRYGQLYTDGGTGAESQLQYSQMKIQKLLDGGCDCGSKSCFPCALKPLLTTALYTTHISYRFVDWDGPDAGEVLPTHICGVTSPDRTNITITSAGFKGFTIPYGSGQCNLCPTAVIFHELLHSVGLDHVGPTQMGPVDPVWVTDRACAGDLCKGVDYPDLEFPN